MLVGCSALEKINISGWKLTSATNLTYVFYNCPNLKTIIADGLLIGTSANTTAFISGCNNLIEVSIKNSDSYSVNKVISLLPTKSQTNKGDLYIEGVVDLSLVNLSSAQSKHWNVN